MESPGQLRAQTGPVSGGTSFDPYLRIFDDQGQEIASQNDATGGNSYPDLTTGLLAPGVYYVGLSSFANTGYDPADGSGAFGGGSMGDYQLTVSLSNPDPDGVVQGSREVDLTSPNALNPDANLVNVGVYVTNQFLNQSIGEDSGGLANPSQELEPNAGTVTVGDTDVDFYRVIAPDSGVIFIETDTTPYGSSGIDPYLEVFTQNPVTKNLEFVDDNTDGFLAISVAIGQTYFVAVTTAGNQGFDPQDPFGRTSTTHQTGQYDLFLSFFNGDVNGTALGAVDFTTFDELDGSKDGSINGVIGADFGQPLLGANGGFKDVDFLTYTPAQDGLLDIDLTVPAGAGDPLDGVLGIWELNSSQTDIMQVVDTNNKEPHAIVQVSANETLYISVTGKGNSGFNWSAPGSGTGGDTGDYRLSITERPTSTLASLTNNSIAQNTPTPISQGQLFAGNIGFDNDTFLGATDVDVFAYTPAVDQIVRIQTFANQEDSADTFLRIFDAGGNELAFNDNSHPGTKGSEITIRLVRGQTYYIGVNGNSANAHNYNPLTGTSAATGSTGDYSLLITEAPPPIYATGADAGGGPHVRVFDARDNAQITSLYAYNPLFTGGVRVAVGDVTGDNVDDVVMAPGPGGGPHIRVLDGATLQFRTEPIYDFFAFAPGMTMGLNVAVGDVNDDGYGDIIVAPEAGSSPAVRVFSGADGSILKDFYAYDLNVSGGVRIAAADVTGDGAADIITVPGPGFPARVRVFDGGLPQTGVGVDLAQSSGLRIGSFYAFDGFTGGAYVAAGDVNDDGLPDVIVGAGAGGGPRVQVFNASNNGPSVLADFYAYDPGFHGGVRVGATEFSLDDHADIVTAAGPGGGPHVRVFDTQNPNFNVENNFVYGGFTGGVFVSGSKNYTVQDQIQFLAGGGSLANAAGGSLALAVSDGKLEPTPAASTNQSGEPSDGAQGSAAGFINPASHADEEPAPASASGLAAVSSDGDWLAMIEPESNDPNQIAAFPPVDPVASAESPDPSVQTLDAVFVHHGLLGDLLQSSVEE